MKFTKMFRLFGFMCTSLLLTATESYAIATCVPANGEVSCTYADGTGAPSSSCNLQSNSYYRFECSKPCTATAKITKTCNSPCALKGKDKDGNYTCAPHSLKGSSLDYRTKADCDRDLNGQFAASKCSYSGSCSQYNTTESPACFRPTPVPITPEPSTY